MLFHSYCTAAIAATLVTPQALAASTSTSASTGVEKNKNLRGGGDYVAASANKQHHRALQEEDVFTFLVADVQYEDGVTASSRNRNLQGNSQGRGNGRGNNPNKPEHTINVQDAHGLIYEIEEGSGDTAGVKSGAKVILPSQAFRNTNGKINLGGGSLKSKKPKKNQKRDLLQEDDSATDLRRHLATTGPKTVVAVRVVAANNAAYNKANEAGLSDDVFGTNGDAFNLKTGYEQCSHGQLTINPGGSDYGINNGVTTITVDTAASSGNDEAMRNAVTAQINAQFGVSNPTEIADYWMYCLPPNVMNGIAYAFINSWQSVYSNEWCNYPSAQIHEVGHNFGYGHSNEGSQDYGDQSGMMGYSYSQDEGPVMCFNAAKTWQTGWMNNGKQVNMNIGGSGATDNCLETDITGQADYDIDLDQTIIVKMNKPSGRDLFLMYNKKTGINSGTLEGGNTVMVVEADSEGTAYGESWLVGKLGAGASKTFADYLGDGSGRDLVITVPSINDGKAQVKIDFDGLCDRTMAPTTSPCGNPSQKQVSVQITTDDYPEETSWTLKKVGSCAGQIDPNLSSPTYASKNTLQPIFEQCVDKGLYQFTINDAYGDGMCCGYGTGSFRVLYGDKDVFEGQGGDFGSIFTGNFGECEDTPSSPPTSAPVNPTPVPTAFPTNPPTPNPTSPPTAFPTQNPTTANPTPVPTKNPTAFPTNPPTNFPTNAPVNPPTATPTSVPTSPPTALPTTPPTPAPSAPLTPAPTNGGGAGPQEAVFDSGYGVPRCANTGSSCDSLALLNGKGTMTNGNELNRSNTNQNGATCSDGNDGTYLVDESIEQITVTAGDIVSGSPVPSGDFIVEGGRAYVTVKVWCWETGASDTADIYLTNDASNPDWQPLASIACPGGGSQTIRYAFDVPQGTNQSIRVNFRYNGSPSTCSNGSYDDHDDLIFTVKEDLNATPSPTPVPTLPPTPMPTNKAPSGPQTASYDLAFGAPKCTVGSSCDSGVLLNGRGSITPVELNQPNTLNSCTDGSSGSYHEDESIDKIVVSRASGGLDDLTEGDVVTISATVWCWNTGSDDNIDFYYASDASNPVWTKIGERQQCPGGGIQTVTASYTLPQGAIQAVRANLMYGSNNPSADSCVRGDYDDTDDLVITVKPNPTLQGAAASASPSKNDDVQGTIVDGLKDIDADSKKKELMDKNKSTSKPKANGKGSVNKGGADKYICSKGKPFASTICADGSPADDICSPENVGRSCGNGGKKCWWAECD